VVSFVQVKENAVRIMQKPSVDGVLDQAKDKQARQKTGYGSRSARLMPHSKISKKKRAGEVSHVRCPVIGTAL
jgi:hypothetical protein